MNILNAQRKNHMLFVSHTWSISYLMRNAGAHYRKFLRVLSKRISLTGSDWVGNVIWGSPVVALAPPYKRCNWINRNCNWINRNCNWINRNCNWINRNPSARLSISIGAGDAMLSYPTINEKKNHGKPR